MGAIRLRGVAWLISTLAIASSSACSGGGDVRTVELPHIELPNGQEFNDKCFSYSLDNEETIYIHSVQMQGTRGIHHSNWFHIPEDVYAGSDGMWSCDARGFDTNGAATAGGVLFAQSTQARDEKQEFRPGAAIVIPPHSRIVGDLHLLNTFGEDVTVDIRLDLRSIPEEQVETELAGISISYTDLKIPPRSRSEFTVRCDGITDQHQRATGRPLDFSIHYVLPHYHELGDLLRLEVAGGPNDGEVIWETRSMIGEPLGGRLDPAYDLTGAEGLELTCGFNNPRNERVGWGVGDQEMCIAFGFTDSAHLWSGSTPGGSNQVVGETDSGTVRNEAPCEVVSFPANL